MSKLDELRNYISNLFDQAQDKQSIEAYGAVRVKIDEIAAEQKAAQEDYSNLLKDYKEVVLHSSFKPVDKADRGADSPTAPVFDANKAFEEALKGQLKGD